MDLGLKGKIALVFGAGGGLGGAIAAGLAHEGAKVALADIDAGALEPLATKLRAQGAEVLSLQWDLGDLSLIDANIRKIEQEFGEVDILVNNTGGPPPHIGGGSGYRVME